MSALYDDVKDVFEFARGDVKRVGTGLRNVDRFIRGVAPGEVCTLLGASFSGKSIIGQNIIYHNKDIPSIFFSMEMPATQALIRLYAMWSGTDAPVVQEQIETGNPPEDMWDIATAFSKHRINDTPDISVNQMSMAVSDYESDFGFRPEFVVVDYLELLGGTAAGAEGVQGVDAQATMLKNWAKAEDMRVFLLHQTNAGKKEWEAPDRSSARYGGYTQSDFVIGLWRPHKNPKADFTEQIRLKSVIAANVIKNRPFFDTADYIELSISPSLRIRQEEVHEFRSTNAAVGSGSREGSVAPIVPSETSGDSDNSTSPSQPTIGQHPIPY